MKEFDTTKSYNVAASAVARVINERTEFTVYAEDVRSIETFPEAEYFAVRAGANVEILCRASCTGVFEIVKIFKW